MKLPAFVVVALMGSTTFALAENSLGMNQIQHDKHMVIFDTVTADADGVIQVYNFQSDQVGKLLGTHPIRAGANTDITVDLSDNPETSALAILVVGDKPVAMEHIGFSDEMPD